MAIQPKFLRHYLPPADHLAAIGSVAVIWTGIESTMETTILGLYEIDMGRGLVLTTNIGFHPRLALLRILTGEKVHMTAAQATEMAAILTRVDSGYGDRNAIVHGLWRRTDDPDVIKRMSVRARGKKLQAVSQTYKAQDLWDISDRLADLLKDFADLGNRIGIKELLEAAPRHTRAPAPGGNNKSK